LTEKIFSDSINIRKTIANYNTETIANNNTETIANNNTETPLHYNSIDA
jgi:hypothetical protein